MLKFSVSIVQQKNDSYGRISFGELRKLIGKKGRCVFAAIKGMANYLEFEDENVLEIKPGGDNSWYIVLK